MKNTIFWIMGVLFCTSFSSAWGLEEASLPKSFFEVAVPYFHTGTAGIMYTDDLLAIHYRVFEPSSGPVKGNLVIVNGFIEFMEKYSEVVYDLRNSGYRIFLYDHRGQGESERMLADSRKAYVAHFQDYIDDLAKFEDTVVAKYPAPKNFMLAHSMGGSIATQYVIQHPGKVMALAESSPMFKANLHDFWYPIAWGLEAGAALLQHSQDYALGVGPNDWNKPFAQNIATTSPYRYADEINALEQNPSFIVSGATYGWVDACLWSNHWIENNIEKLTTPTLVLAAGSDHFVYMQPEIDLCAKAAKAHPGICQSLSEPFHFAQHEIFMEQDDVRNVAIKAVLSHFAQF